MQRKRAERRNALQWGNRGGKVLRKILTISPNPKDAKKRKGEEAGNREKTQNKSWKQKERENPYRLDTIVPLERRWWYVDHIQLLLLGSPSLPLLLPSFLLLLLRLPSSSLSSSSICSVFYVMSQERFGCESCDNIMDICIMGLYVRCVSKQAAIVMTLSVSWTLLSEVWHSQVRLSSMLWHHPFNEVFVLNLARAFEDNMHYAPKTIIIGHVKIVTI